MVRIRYGLDGGRGWAARMLCSETCGCQVPGGHLARCQGSCDAQESRSPYRAVPMAMVILLGLAR